MPLDLKGIFPPVPTPFEHGHFAPRRLSENFARWNNTGLAGYVLLGSNGEAPLLSDAERLEVVRVARKEIPANKLLLVGTGMESTEATIVLTMRVADLGAAAALVVNPFYYRPQLSRAALRKYFEAIAEASPIPIVLYNVPKFTGVNLSVELIAQLAEHPNLIGMKDSAGNLAQLVELREKTPAGFQILIGADAVFFAGLMHGMDGAILALANVAPHECVKLYESVKKEEWQEGRVLAEKLAPLGRIIVARHGVPGLKAALEEAGYYGGAPRLPLLEAETHVRREIREALGKAGIALRENDVC